MENNKHPRRNSGRGILDVHPTQLRRGEVSDVKPEQLHIIEINPEHRANAVKQKEQELRIANQASNVKREVTMPKGNVKVDTVQRNPEIRSLPRSADNFVKASDNVPDVKTKFIKINGVSCGKEENKPIAGTVQSSGTSIQQGKSHSKAKSIQPLIKKDISQLQKKSSEKEQKTRRIVNSILCCSFALFVISGAVISLAHMANKNKPAYSEYEKRALEQMPEFTVSALADGSYTHGIDSFFADNFPFRESLVKKATSLKRFRGIRAFNKNAKQVIHGDSDIYSDGEMEIHIDEDRFNNADAIVLPGLSGITEQTVTPPKEEISDISDDEDNTGSNVGSEPVVPQLPDKYEDTYEMPEQTYDVTESNSSTEQSRNTDTAGELKGDKRDTIYILGDTAYEYFRGTTKSAADYVKVINTYAKYIPEGINIYTLVIPTHPEFGLAGADRTVSNEQKPVLDYIGSNLDARIKFADPHAKLLEAYKNGEYIYYRTDHHWTIRGAYCAYLEFCERAGIVPASSDSFEKGRIEPFLGTFYSASGKEQSLASNPDYVEYFVIDAPCTVTRYDKKDNPSNGKLFYRSVRGESNGYLAFMGGDFPYAHIKTENTNGKKLMIFKESFANPLIGLLAPHYEELHIADIRYFKYNPINFIKQYGVTDVLFCNGIMSANSKARVNDLVELLNK